MARSNRRRFFEVGLVKCMKGLQSDFFLEDAKPLNGTAKALEDFDIGAHRKVANCVAMLADHFDDVQKFKANDAPASDIFSDGKR